MRARLLLREKQILGEDRFAEITIWQLPAPTPERPHGFKYRLAYVVDEVCVLQFDNESGKGDHKHVGAKEARYDFKSLDQLVTDFWKAIEDWRPR